MRAYLIGPTAETHDIVIVIERRFEPHLDHTLSEVYDVPMQQIAKIERAVLIVNTCLGGRAATFRHG